jgi:hypothetical protein
VVQGALQPEPRPEQLGARRRAVRAFSAGRTRSQNLAASLLVYRLTHSPFLRASVVLALPAVAAAILIRRRIARRLTSPR